GIDDVHRLTQALLSLRFITAMVAVAQLVEPWIVIPVVAGSSPVSHPSFFLLSVFRASPASSACLSRLAASHRFLARPAPLPVFPWPAARRGAVAALASNSARPGESALQGQ